jgi:hypothetical protein
MAGAGEDGEEGGQGAAAGGLHEGFVGAVGETGGRGVALRAGAGAADQRQ